MSIEEMFQEMELAVDNQPDGTIVSLTVDPKDGSEPVKKCYKIVIIDGMPVAIRVSCKGLDGDE
jgi:hypothetical protein